MAMGQMQSGMNSTSSLTLQKVVDAIRRDMLAANDLACIEFASTGIWAGKQVPRPSPPSAA
jgi:hypothetical protein